MVGISSHAVVADQQLQLHGKDCNGGSTAAALGRSAALCICDHCCMHTTFCMLQNYQNWIFVSVVKGGSAANAMIKSLESEWGRKLYGRTLISNIGSAVYKVSWLQPGLTSVDGLQRQTHAAGWGGCGLGQQGLDCQVMPTPTICSVVLPLHVGV